MKNTLASIASLTLLSGYGYPSFYEAEYECSKWVQEGGTYMWLIKSIAEINDNKNQIKELIRYTVNTFSLRKCQKEAETSQVLGLNIKK